MTGSNRDIVRVRTCHDLLGQYNSLHLLSCSMTAAGALALFFTLIMQVYSIYVSVMLVILVLFGVLETFLAVRVGFDKALLSHLAVKSEITDDDLAALDEALAHLKLRSNPETGRPLESRLNGSMRLFRQQARLCGAQVALLLATAGLHAMKMLVAGT